MRPKRALAMSITLEPAGTDLGHSFFVALYAHLHIDREFSFAEPHAIAR